MEVLVTLSEWNCLCSTTRHSKSDTLSYRNFNWGILFKMNCRALTEKHNTRIMLHRGRLRAQRLFSLTPEGGSLEDSASVSLVWQACYFPRILFLLRRLCEMSRTLSLEKSSLVCQLQRTEKSSFIWQSPAFYFPFNSMCLGTLTYQTNTNQTPTNWSNK